MKITENLRTLYLSYDGITDHLGQSQIIAYLRRLASHHHGFFLISFEKPERYSEVSDSVRDMIFGKKINWYPMRYTKYPLIFSTLCDLFRCFGKAVILHRRHRFHIVHCRSHVPALVGLLMKRIFKVKFIFDMRGWWVDEKMESGHWDNWIFKPIYYLMKRLEVLCLVKSDHIVVLTHASKSLLIQKHQQLFDRITVIPTCVDFKIFGEFSKQARYKIRSSLGISMESIVLIYSGSFGGNYNVKNIIKIFEVFIEQYPTSQFIVLSKTNPDLLHDYLSSNSLLKKKCRLLTVEYREVHKYLSAADIGIIYYKVNFSALGRSPTKLGEYWACGVPVLAQKGIGDLDHIQKTYPFGLILVDDLSKKSFNNGIIQMTNSIGKKNLKSASEEYFGIEKGISAYERVYSLLT